MKNIGKYITQGWRVLAEIHTAIWLFGIFGISTSSVAQFLLSLPEKNYWPLLLLAALLGGAFMMVSFYAHGPAQRGSENFNALLLATGIAFVPILVLEWIFCIVIRSTDGEHQRVRDLLVEYLQTGKMTA